MSDQRDAKQELRELHWRICAKLDDIRAMFNRPDDARLTLVVRMPWLDDGGVLVGDDTAEEAIVEIRRLAAKEAEIARQEAP